MWIPIIWQERLEPTHEFKTWYTNVKLLSLWRECCDNEWKYLCIKIKIYKCENVQELMKKIKKLLRNQFKYSTVYNTQLTDHDLVYV